jgi:hypothetical protein
MENFKIFWWESLCVSKNQCVLLGSPLFLWGAPFFPLGLAPCVLGLGLGSRVGACPSLPGPLACAACGVASPSSVPWSLLCPLLLSLSRSLVLSRLGSLLPCCLSLLLLRWCLLRGFCLLSWLPFPVCRSRLRSRWSRCRLSRAVWWCCARTACLVVATGLPWLVSVVLPRLLLLLGSLLTVGPLVARSGLWPWVAGLCRPRLVASRGSRRLLLRRCGWSSFGRALRCATCWWHTRGCLNRRSSVHVSKEN